MRWCIGLAAAALVSYFTAMQEADRRITKVETITAERWDFVKSSMLEIRDELKSQRVEIRDIVREWARGVDRQTGEPLPLQRSIDNK